MADEQAKSAINGVESSTWNLIAKKLNGPSRICCEPEISLLSKDVIRKNVSYIKRKIREYGYNGKKIEYIEMNVRGCNGYTFYCVDKITEIDAKEILRTEIVRARFDQP
ncbi:hypothetical protein [Azospirillum sp. B4]|uniref:hypothetical protein n=1 Tax=Azospirillum sp. B4 TaxID=95605 RepID=UPI0011DD8FD5|nr:hypothetical protein [Azospirillum sp. B4]